MKKVPFPLLYLLELDTMEKNGGIILPHVYNSNVSQPMGLWAKGSKSAAAL